MRESHSVRDKGGYASLSRHVHIYDEEGSIPSPIGLPLQYGIPPPPPPPVILVL